MLKTKCELCNSNNSLIEYKVEPKDKYITICDVCDDGIKNPQDNTHWHCLNDSMWSEDEGVKVVIFRLLKTLGKQDLLDMLYLDDATKEWAESINYANMDAEIDADIIIHKDANGVVLQSGDNVIIAKDLDVKGANFTAKRGLVVKNISLVSDDAGHIEGRVNGTKIFIKTCFLKKA